MTIIPVAPNNELFVILAAAGGLAVKFIEGVVARWLENKEPHNRRSEDRITTDERQESIDRDSEHLRKELREENEHLRHERDIAKTDADAWRIRYWEEVERANDPEHKLDSIRHLPTDIASEVDTSDFSDDDNNGER